jgi:DNA modification methylase
MKVLCKFDKMLPISEFKGFPNNPNIHSKEQIERLAKILEYQGIRAPVIISNLTGYCVKGHGTVKAIIKNGWHEIPIVYQDFSDHDQEYSYVVSDNSIASWADLDFALINNEIPEFSPDFDIDMLGIEDFEIEPADKYADKDADAVPEVRESFVKTGDIWQLGNHRLMCGDSTDRAQIDALMNGEKSDMVFTDPPYGVDAVGGDKAVGGGKIVKSNRYERVIGDLSPETAKKGVLLCESLGIETQIWFGANNYSHALPESNGWLYWQKNQTGDFADGELAWTSSKGSIKRFEHTWAGLIKESERGQKRCHPTQKPIALAEWCFETYAKDSKSVLDLFGGSGSTLIACEKTNRKCFMMEIDKHYCGIIIERWQQFTGQRAVRLTQRGRLNEGSLQVR